jgi:hypothetical protein
MKTVVRFSPWVLLLLALVMIGLDWRKISILQSENNGLRVALQGRQAAESNDAAHAR